MGIVVVGGKSEKGFKRYETGREGFGTPCYPRPPVGASGVLA